MATLHSIPKSTLGDIWSDHDNIEYLVSVSDCPSVAKERCGVRKAKFEELEEACYVQKCSKGAPVSGPVRHRPPPSDASAKVERYSCTEESEFTETVLSVLLLYSDLAFTFLCLYL